MRVSRVELGLKGERTAARIWTGKSGEAVAKRDLWVRILRKMFGWSKFLSSCFKNSDQLGFFPPQNKVMTTQGSFSELTPKRRKLQSKSSGYRTLEYSEVNTRPCVTSQRGERFESSYMQLQKSRQRAMVQDPGFINFPGSTQMKHPLALPLLMITF